MDQTAVISQLKDDVEYLSEQLEKSERTTRRLTKKLESLQDELDEEREKRDKEAKEILKKQQQISTGYKLAAKMCADRLVKVGSLLREVIQRNPTTKDTDAESKRPRVTTPIYSTSICRECTVSHETGVVSYAPSSPFLPVGQFISAEPLTKEYPSFSFEIIEPGNSCYIAIGVCNRGYPRNTMPGWNTGSVGYHADDGGIFIESGYASEKKATCSEGDIMTCIVNFDQKKIEFYKNGLMIYSILRQGTLLSNMYAAVGFHSEGEAVMLLEKEPWSKATDT